MNERTDLPNPATDPASDVDEDNIRSIVSEAAEQLARSQSEAAASEEVTAVQPPTVYGVVPHYEQHEQNSA